MSQINFNKRKSKTAQEREIRDEYRHYDDMSYDHDDSNGWSAQKVIGVIMVIAGLIGLGCHIEYSGWVLFFGILAAID